MDPGLLPAPELWLPCLAAIFVAAVLRGFTGFGFAVAAVPLLAMVLHPEQAVVIAVALQLAVGLLVDVRKSRSAAHWPSLLWLTLGAAVGSPLGLWVLTLLSADTARIAIGAICLMAVALLAAGLRLKRLPGALPTLGTGLFAGLCNGLAAMPGPPAVAFYMAGPLEPAAVRASLLVLFTATSIVAAIGGIALGLWHAPELVLALCGFPVMLLGSRLGAIGFDRSAGRLHRPVSLALLFAIAATSLVQGLVAAMGAGS